MKAIALTPPDQVCSRDRAAEITAILAAAITRSSVANPAQSPAVGLAFFAGQSVHTTPSQQES
jgi:hypothetical protein